MPLLSRQSTNPGLTYHREVELKEQNLACSREFKLKTVDFSPEAILQAEADLENNGL